MKHALRLLAFIAAVFFAGFLLEELIESLPASIHSPETSVEIITDFFPVFVSFSIFAMTWFAYSRNRDNHSLFMGMAFLVIGVIDLFHLLSYPFMPDFITQNSLQKAGFLHAEARLISAVLFLASSYVYRDTLPELINKPTLFAFGVILFLASFFPVLFFPDYMPEISNSSELATRQLITAALILYASYRYGKRIQATGQAHLTYLIYGFIILIVSDLVYFDYELSGHLLKTTGFIFIHLALYKSSVELPYEKLEEAEEKLLHVTEEKYRNLFNNANDAIVTVDLANRVTSWNHSAEKIFGWTAEEIMGKKLFSLIVPERMMGETDKIVYNTLALKTISGIENVCLRKDGTEITVDFTTSVIRDEKGNVEGISGILRDITEHKQAEEALAASEEKHRTLIENIQDGVFIIQDSKMQFVNEAFAKIGGYTVQEVIGKDFRKFVAPEDLDMVVDNYQRRQAGENVPKEYEFRILHKDGNTRILVNINVGLIPYRGRIASMGTVKDITERKKAEEIRLENVCLTLASKAKSEFLATMSHELRTPLNSIIGFSELLKEKAAGELNEKQVHYVHNVLASGKHLLYLINDILDLSKVEAGKMELSIEKISVPETINETIDLIKEKAIKHNVVMKTELDPDVVFIEADGQKFKQILFNLLSNAVKFSKPEGGTVIVAAKKEGDMARFWVIDTGIGIKEEDMARLFMTFEQLDSGISRNYGGTGLGLAISKKLVELMGGSIMAESKYGDGSTFTFTLPITAKRAGEIK